MAEVGRSVKFKTIFLAREDVSRRFAPHIATLLDIARQLTQLGLAKKAYGNISVRVRDGFVIKRNGASLASLTSRDFVLVTRCEVDKVYCLGMAEPSCETRLHHLIYEARPHIRYVLHVHDEQVVRNYHRLSGVRVVQAHPYGTLRLAREVASVARECDYVVIRDHGIVALGKNATDAMKKVRQAHEEAGR
jgi:ribulose-5-phosphate 4-epimerase/fuculose-1-phosphate aldolase